MPFDYEALRQRPIPVVTQTYLPRDAILYALGVGVATANPVPADDLKFVYEERLAALPTMGVVLATGPFWMQDPATGIDWKRILHGEQMLTVHSPLPPSGTVRAETTIDEIYDKGADKGAVMYLTRRLLPGGGGTQRLPRPIGIEKALPLLLEGRRLEPAEALALGIVDEVVAGKKLIDTARRWVRANPGAKQPWDRDGYAIPGGAGSLGPHANRTFKTSTAQVMERTQGNYPAPLAILSAVYEGVALPIELGLRVEAQYFATLLTGPVARNLMRTLVLNRPRSEKLSGVCVERTRAALADEVARLRNEGVAPALIENAARAAGMSVSSVTGTDGVSRLEPRAMVLPRADQPSIEEVKKRLLYIQALEGARCLEEGVVTHPADADLGAVLGAGFPSWTGGTLSFIETVGMRAFVAGCERMAERHGARFRPSAWLKARAERDETFYSLARVSQ